MNGVNFENAATTGETPPTALDLISRQIAMECDMRAAAERRSETRAEAARARGAQADGVGGRAAVNTHTVALETALRAHLAQPRKARRGGAERLLDTVDPRVAAFVTLRQMINRAASRPGLTDLARQIGESVEDESRFAKLRAEDAKRFRKLEKRARRLSDPRARRRFYLNQIKRIEAREDAAAPIAPPWPTADRDRAGVVLIALAITSTGLFEIAKITSQHRSMNRVRPTEKLTRSLNEAEMQGAWLAPIYEPMVVKPKPWSGARGGGYLTRSARPLALVKRATPEQLAEFDAPDFEARAPIVLTAINAAQETGWRINRAVLGVMSALQAAGAARAGLPAATPSERPTRPRDTSAAETSAEAAARRRADERWRAHEMERRSKVLVVDGALRTARRYKDFDAIYFPMSFDFRGRLYCAPSFSPQGPDLMRGLLEFAEAKPLGSEGWKWLAIHLCNCGDFEKMSKAPLSDRVEWVFRNEERILTCAADPLADSWWEEADKPWQFLAACLEWARFAEEGPEATSRLPIALDGSCSGIQHFSMALRDPVGGAAVNLTAAPRAADIYQEVADRVNALIERDLASSETIACGRGADGAPILREVAALARQWRAFGVTRAVCKRPTMTYGYGARGYGYVEMLMEDTLGPALKAYWDAPEDADGDAAAWPFDEVGFAAALYLSRRLTEAVEQVVVKAAEAMRWLQTAATVATRAERPLQWPAPDGFPVRQAYLDTRQRRVRAIVGGESLRLTVRDSGSALDARRQRQGVAPNFVHALDACHLRLLVCRAMEEGITSFALIHDCFGVHAADTPRFFQIVRESLVEMYDTVDVMGAFHEALAAQLPPEAAEKLPPPPQSGSLDISQVLDSEFCFA